jgi:hypothetical protein
MNLDIFVRPEQSTGEGEPVTEKYTGPVGEEYRGILLIPARPVITLGTSARLTALDAPGVYLFSHNARARTPAKKMMQVSATGVEVQVFPEAMGDIRIFPRLSIELVIGVELKFRAFTVRASDTGLRTVIERDGAKITIIGGALRGIIINAAGRVAFVLNDSLLSELEFAPGKWRLAPCRPRDIAF